MGDTISGNGWLLVWAVALVPFALVMLTSFTKLVVVLSLLRNAVGVADALPNLVVVGLAMALTMPVVVPLGGEIAAAVSPAGDATTLPESLVEGVAMARRASEPVRRFLSRHSGPAERAALVEVASELASKANGASSDTGSGAGPGASSGKVADRDLSVLIPAFLLTELKEAFAVGFLLFLPFMVLDLVVASLLVALGMPSLSPVTIALPVKLLFFVAVDGWQLIARGLLLGYG